MNKNIKILIAKDSPAQDAKLQNFLEQEGYQVILARNGKEALDSLKKFKPALVISDIIMPEIDGYELCRTIRADEYLKIDNISVSQ